MKATIIRIMRVIGAVAVLSAGAGQAAASDRSEIIAVVQAFNAASTKEAYQSHCTEDAVVIDHVPPLVFDGPKACAVEWDAVVEWAAKNGFSLDGFVQTLYAPSFLSITGTQAYAVFPGKASFSFKRRQEVERLYATFVLRRQADGWRIARVTYTSLGWKPDAAVGR